MCTLKFSHLPFLLLTGDLSEDPKYPKAQWPAPGVCPACHEETEGLHSWDRGHVLQFLKHHYDTGNILYTYTESEGGLREEELWEDKKNVLVKKQSRRHDDKISDPGKLSDSNLGALGRLTVQDIPKAGGNKAALESFAGKETKQGVSFLGIGFSNIDMSLCVVLYVASSLFLMIIFLFFRMRSKRWKVKHYRPYT